MTKWKTVYGELEVPDNNPEPENLIQCFDGFYSILEKEQFCLKLQQQQPDFIERNKRLMKAGKIEFDEYEELI